MKLPSRHIIILLIVSLTALFGYQVYWLSGLYKSRYQSAICKETLMSDSSDW